MSPNLLLCSRSFPSFDFFGNLCSEIDDFAAIVRPARHADLVCLVQSSTTGALRQTRLPERVMRTPIIAVRPR